MLSLYDIPISLHNTLQSQGKRSRKASDKHEYISIKLRSVSVVHHYKSFFIQSSLEYCTPRKSREELNLYTICKIYSKSMVSYFLKCFLNSDQRTILGISWSAYYIRFIAMK